MAPLIRVIGSLNIDFTTTTARFPGPGETLTAKSLSVNAGGKGANQAVACGRASFISETEQDLRVEMVGAVGANDPYYTSLLKPTLQGSGVDCEAVLEVGGAQTGTATIIVDEGSGGENRILVVPGANHAGMSDVDEVLTRAFREPLPQVFVMQGEIPRTTVLAILEKLKKMENEAPLVVLNPAPVYESGIPKALLSISARLTLIVNETELVQCAQTTEGLEISAKFESDLKRDKLDEVAYDFHNAGISSLIVTLGSKGVYFSTQSLPQDKAQQMLLPAAKVNQVADTTAAGDTFVGFYVAELARWKGDKAKSQVFNMEEAISRANKASGQCVQRVGAMQSIPWYYELERLGAME